MAGNGMDRKMEQIVEEFNLHRHLNSLIVAHLRDNKLYRAASAVASATMIPLNVEVLPNRLLDLVSKGLVVEKGEPVTGSVPVPRIAGIDFSASLDVNVASKIFPNHETRLLSYHMNAARCARFSPDGKYVATGGADKAIKVFEVAKINQRMQSDFEDGSILSNIVTFYDHKQPINDLDFHPTNSILISGAKDNTIKFFDFTKTTATTAFKVIRDNHNVRSVSFHPSGNYLMAGTDHQIPHLYDINTFKCYVAAYADDNAANAAINQIRYSSTGDMCVTASKDGAIRLWDGVSAKCVRLISGAHGTESTSANFTKDNRYILSCGKDSTVKLWEVGTGRLVKQYVGATHPLFGCQAVFSHTEEFVLSLDEWNNEVVVWDAVTATEVTRLWSNHIGPPMWIEHSPVEAAFTSCGYDRSVRFWNVM